MRAWLFAQPSIVLSDLLIVVLGLRLWTLEQDWMDLLVVVAFGLLFVSGVLRMLVELLVRRREAA